MWSLTRLDASRTHRHLRVPRSPSRVSTNQRWPPAPPSSRCRPLQGGPRGRGGRLRRAKHRAERRRAGHAVRRRRLGLVNLGLGAASARRRVSARSHALAQARSGRAPAWPRHRVHVQSRSGGEQNADVKRKFGRHCDETGRMARGTSSAAYSPPCGSRTPHNTHSTPQPRPDPHAAKPKALPTVTSNNGTVTR